MSRAASISILHVDDDPALLELLVAFLERLDAEADVVSVASRDDAVETLRSDTAVDVVVSDFSLPNDGGLDLLDTVRDEQPDLPFVFFTGRVEGEDVAREHGATDYFVKGDVSVLMALAERLVEVTGADGSDEVDHSRTEPSG